MKPHGCWVVMESDLRVFKQVNFRNTGLDFEAADSKSASRACPRVRYRSN